MSPCLISGVRASRGPTPLDGVRAGKHTESHAVSCATVRHALALLESEG